MDDTNGKMNTGYGKKLLNPFAVKKPKKRSLVERELETNMTARITLPVTVADGLSTSRYGRARRIKNRDDNNTSIELLKSPTSENTPVKQSPVRQSTANISDRISFMTDTSKKAFENSCHNVDNICDENKTLSRFNTNKDAKSSATKSPKVYIQKDLIQNRDDDDDIILIKDLFSPKGTSKGTPQSNRKRMKPSQSSEKTQSSSKKQSGHMSCVNVDNASVVKALDFDENKTGLVSKKLNDGNKKSFDGNKSDSTGNKKKKHEIDEKAVPTKLFEIEATGNKKKKDGIVEKAVPTKLFEIEATGNTKKKDGIDQKAVPNKLFEIEAASPYQVGDLAWARMGTFPFWPCIITRDPANNMFVRSKLFGRVVHNILHVTFFADNGRRSWVVDNMLRSYNGLGEFMSIRDKFTAEDKKKDPRLYAAFFISEKKQSLWNASVEEAEMINREPKRTRVDVFHDALYKSRELKKRKSSKVSSRTDSDVSLSESLYDSLFSEDDSKDDSIRTRNRTKNRSLDVSEIVTACLDNMAAKTGNIKIQRQSHMDRWLQKAKSKTPEKVKTKNDRTPIKDPIVIPKTEPFDNLAAPKVVTFKVHNDSHKLEKPVKNNKKRKLPPKEVKITKVYGLRRSYDTQNSFIQLSENKSNNIIADNDTITVTDVHSTRNELKKQEVVNIAENNLNATEQLQKIQKDNNNEAMDVVNLSDEESTREKNIQSIGKKISTPTTVSEKTSIAEVDFINIEIKPEVMDVGVNKESDIQVAVKSSTAKEIFVVLDSPVKIEKESPITTLVKENSSLESKNLSTNTLKGVSPVKIEKQIETSVLIASDTNSTTNKSTIIIEKKSSPLKNNEMVLIPENITLTDDDSNSVTSSDETNRRSVDPEHNKSNYTLIKRAKINVVDQIDKAKTLISDHVLAKIDQHSFVTNDISDKKTDEQIEKANKPTENQTSFDENVDKDVSMTKNDLCNQSGDPASMLQIGSEVIGLNEKPDDNPLPAGNVLSQKNSKTEASEKKLYQNSNKLNTKNPFLDDSRNIDCVDSAIVNREHFFRAENLNKPPDLTHCQKNSEIDQSNSDHAEDSDDEPSPEFEPLEEDIKEDFRQHMMCIESNITDRKDDAQLVKVCNEIAVLEESKFKLNDIKSNICKISNYQSLEITKLNDEQIISQLSLESDKFESSLTTEVSKNKEVKAESLESIADFTHSVETNLKSPPDKKRYNLSLKKDKLKTERVNEREASLVNVNTINPLYKTIDQIEEIIKSNPKKLPIENGEVYIPGIVHNEFKKEIDTSEIEDVDFDIEKASVSSEDSEVSLPHNNKPARRSLRSKPERKVGLQDADFLAYMELRQDDLMEEHPDLTRDDIVLYLYKTYTYSQNLQPEVKLEESALKGNQTVKQETPTTPRKISKKQVQTKNTIENFFREKVNKSTRIEKERSENAGPSVNNEQVTPKRENLLVSPVDSGLGNSKDSNELYTPVSKRRSKSVTPKDLTEVTKEIKTEVINEINKSSSPKTTKDSNELYTSLTKRKNKSITPKDLTEVTKEIKIELTNETNKSTSPKTPKDSNELYTCLSKRKNKAITPKDLTEVTKEIKKELINEANKSSSPKTPKDSNELYTSLSKRRNKSITPKDLTEVTKEIKKELINETNKSSSPKTPRRLRKKTISPRVLGSESKMFNTVDKRVPVVVISPESNITMKIDKAIDKRVPVVVISPEPNLQVKIDKAIDKRVPVVVISPEPNLKVKIDKTMDKRVPVVVISPMKEHKTIQRDPEPLPCDNKPDKTKAVNISVDQNKEVEKIPVCETQHVAIIETKHENTEPESMDSESEAPLRQLRSKVIQEKQLNALKKEIELKDEVEDTASASSDNEPLIKPAKNTSVEGSYDDPEFMKYLELKQDALMDENPHLSHNEITAYLYKTWIYEKNTKSEIRKNDEIESSNLVKGLNPEPVAPQRKAKRKPKMEKVDVDEIIPKEKPKRKTLSHYYNEELLSDVEDELEVFEIFKTKKTAISVVSKPDSPKKERQTETKSEEMLNNEDEDICEEINTLDDVELYFKQLVSPKPSVFKGLIREKVCGICEDISNLIKCKGCHGMFHFECVNRVVEVTDTEKPCVTRGRKKKKKPLNGRKSNDEHHDISEENISIEETESLTVDAGTLESELEAKMKEIMEKETQSNYDSYSSDDGIDWTDTVPGKCELVDVKLKKRSPPVDISNFECNNCSKYDRPICFVCKSAVSKTGVKIRQKCNVAHCHSYYHLECLDHWPQTQFNTGECSRTKTDTLKQGAITCPRHVCHTCVSDDPRGCKTRFSGDKLAKCVRCPATYHSFNKCLPAGTQILTASFIICPRHYEHRPGKVPCHVNTGWCFICALGGSLICCEYCPTSFHAECLNIKPPEGNYMCEDCETGRLPLYGEMVWVKLGHYRWWPGVVLHPSEIPDNIMAVKHGLGEFVVRFFGQYDHYWVNRGRVFPYQEGDSGRVSGQKSKIDAAFTTAMEHAQRAYGILKNAEPDEEESLEIDSSLLPPHYVKLKTNKPTGSLLGRKIEDPSLSLTQCECNPADIEPCGPNSQCLNRVLLTECGPTCRAGERCNNRAFEKRQYPKLTPYRASHRGWGLKTLEDIKAGQFVIEYVGELIDEEEFQWRMKRQHEIRDENFYFLTLDKERMIDAGPKGNLARFMNHCCEPNCETQKWTVLGDIRVGLFAIDDIKANSEVTFNYNLECTGIEKKRCMCGAKRCSGYIGAKPKQLDESQRKKHGLTGKRKYTKRKETEDSPSTSKIKTKREDSPSTSKSKIKRPLGRPRKDKTPKELTEIEKDLLIIKSATPNSDESRPPSVGDKKTDSNTTVQNANSNTESKKISKVEETNATEAPKFNGAVSNDDKVLKTKLDPNTTAEVRILNGIEPKLQKKIDSIQLKESIESKAVKRKASNITDAVAMNSEPCAKRLKCDKRIEVGD